MCYFSFQLTMKLFSGSATPRVGVQYRYLGLHLLVLLVLAIGDAHADCVQWTNRQCIDMESDILSHNVCPNQFYKGLFVSREDIEKLPNDADNMVATLGNYTVLKTFPQDTTLQCIT
jgi:hypothetical protein